MINDIIILIQRTRHGDEAAFTALIRRYQKMVFALTYHYVKNFQDTQEVVQDVFMKVFRRLDTLNDPQHFSIWLKRIVCTESMMFLRRRKRGLVTQSLDVENHEIVSRDIQQYTDGEVCASVTEMLETLPEDGRLLIELRYLGGCTSREIAGLY